MSTVEQLERTAARARWPWRLRVSEEIDDLAKAVRLAGRDAGPDDASRVEAMLEVLRDG